MDRGERGPGTPAALEHLARCGACERDLTDLALTIAALRRAGRELRAEPVPVIAPSRIAALAVRRRSPWSFRFQLGSLLTGAAIAAVVVLPQAGTFASPVSDALTPAQVTASRRLADRRVPPRGGTRPPVARRAERAPTPLPGGTHSSLEGGVPD